LADGRLGVTLRFSYDQFLVRVGLLLFGLLTDVLDFFDSVRFSVGRKDVVEPKLRT
jgi:hypothetical protein